MRSLLLGWVTVGLCVLTHSQAVAGAFFDLRAPSLAAERVVENQLIAPTSGNAPLLRLKPTGNLVGGTPAQNANADAFQTIWGLGVLNRNVPNDRGFFTNTVHVDGNAPEFLRLEFNEAVRLNFVFFHFAGAGSTDRFGLAIDGTPIDLVAAFGTNVIKDLHPPGFAPGFVFFPASLPFGTTFDFFALNWGGAAFDEWNLEKVDVIPEPSCLALLAIATLGSVGWHVSRRRKRS